MTGFFNFTLEGVVTMATVLFLAWNTLRAGLLRAKLNGTAFRVPKDEVKASFQRAALAEASRRVGGRRVNIDYEWKGNTLTLKSDDPGLSDKH